MSYSAKQKREARIRRHRRVRKKVRGTAERPRLAVFRSNKHISAQIIDEADLKTSGGNVDAATKVGTRLAERAKAAGIDAVVFDRGGNLYHGRIKALADAAREGGLEF